MGPAGLAGRARTKVKPAASEGKLTANPYSLEPVGYTIAFDTMFNLPPAHRTGNTGMLVITMPAIGTYHVYPYKTNTVANIQSALLSYCTEQKLHAGPTSPLKRGPYRIKADSDPLFTNIDMQKFIKGVLGAVMELSPPRTKEFNLPMETYMRSLTFGIVAAIHSANMHGCPVDPALLWDKIAQSVSDVQNRLLVTKDGRTLPRQTALSGNPADILELLAFSHPGTVAYKKVDRKTGKFAEHVRYGWYMCMAKDTMQDVRVILMADTLSLIRTRDFTPSNIGPQTTPQIIVGPTQPLTLPSDAPPPAPQEIPTTYEEFSLRSKLAAEAFDTKNADLPIQLPSRKAHPTPNGVPTPEFILEEELEMDEQPGRLGTDSDVLLQPVATPPHPQPEIQLQQLSEPAAPAALPPPPRASKKATRQQLP